MSTLKVVELWGRLFGCVDVEDCWIVSMVKLLNRVHVESCKIVSMLKAVKLLSNCVHVAGC